MQTAGLDPALARVFYTKLAGHALTFAFGRRTVVRLGDSFAAAIGATAGKPKVLFASHTGNWEAALSGVAHHLPLTAIVKRQSQGWAEQLTRRRRRGLELVQPEGSVQRALGALGAGRAVVALGDQAPARRRGAVRDHFLGAPCWTDKSPALLAARARCPLWVVAQYEIAGCTQVELLGSYEPRRATVGAVTLAATAQLDAFVRAHPTDWLWLHRRWKDLPR